MGEYAKNLYLPDEVFEDPIVQLMEAMANDIVTLSNVRDLSMATFSSSLGLIGHILIQYRTSTRRYLQPHRRRDEPVQLRPSRSDGLEWRPCQRTD